MKTRGNWGISYSDSEYPACLSELPTTYHYESCSPQHVLETSESKYAVFSQNLFAEVNANMIFELSC